MLAAIPESAAVVLAAGKGTRMKTDLPKVAVKVAGKPMIEHVLDTLIESGIRHIVVIVGYEKDVVINICQQSKFLDSAKIEFAVQEQQLGTAHALMSAESVLKDFSGNLLVCCGDAPLIRAATIERLFDSHRQSHASVTLLSANFENPRGYGRIVRDSQQNVSAIVEEKDATDEIKKITEGNTGTYVFNSPGIFAALKEVNAENAQKEYYLTDSVSIYRKKSEKVSAIVLNNEWEASGANSPEDLEKLESIFKKEIRAVV